MWASTKMVHKSLFFARMVHFVFLQVFSDKWWMVNFGNHCRLCRRYELIHFPKLALLESYEETSTNAYNTVVNDTSRDLYETSEIVVIWYPWLYYCLFFSYFFNGGWGWCLVPVQWFLSESGGDEEDGFSFCLIGFFRGFSGVVLLLLYSCELEEPHLFFDWIDRPEKH